MPTMNISLPDPLKEFVDAQIASGRYSSASEYVRMLIREDEKHRAEEKLRTLLLEGLATRESDLTRQDFKDIRKAAWERLKTRKKKGHNARQCVSTRPPSAIWWSTSSTWPKMPAWKLLSAFW